MRQDIDQAKDNGVDKKEEESRRQDKTLSYTILNDFCQCIFLKIPSHHIFPFFSLSMLPSPAIL